MGMRWVGLVDGTSDRRECYAHVLGWREYL